jgi:hypothetical protein
MGVADSLQRRREFLLLFGEDPLGREPLVEADVLQQGPQVGLYTREQDGHAAVVFFAQEFLDPLDDDGIRVAHPLEPQHKEFDVVSSDPFAQGLQIPFEFGCSAEEELAFEVVDDDRRIGRITVLRRRVDGRVGFVTAASIFRTGIAEVVDYLGFGSLATEQQQDSRANHPDCNGRLDLRAQRGYQ